MDNEAGIEALSTENRLPERKGGGTFNLSSAREVFGGACGAQSASRNNRRRKLPDDLTALIERDRTGNKIRSQTTYGANGSRGLRDAIIERSKTSTEETKKNGPGRPCVLKRNVRKRMTCSP